MDIMVGVAIHTQIIIIQVTIITLIPMELEATQIRVALMQLTPVAREIQELILVVPETIIPE